MQRLLGVLVSACLVLQPLVVALHLALVDHTHGPVASAGTAAHHSHDHHHPHPHPHPHAPGDDHDAGGQDPDDPHPPHPAEDHLGQQQDPFSTPRAPDFTLPAALPPGDHGGGPADTTTRPPQRPRQVPQRPPPRDPPRPRAPPAIV